MITVPEFGGSWTDRMTEFLMNISEEYTECEPFEQELEEAIGRICTSWGPTEKSYAPKYVIGQLLEMGAIQDDCANRCLDFIEEWAMIKRVLK